MIHWGITCGSHDGALAVYDSDTQNILFATDAERFSRKKNDPQIPQSLMDYALEEYGDPDKVFFYENPFVKVSRRWYAGQKPAWKPPKLPYPYKMKYTSHHKSHAAYGYYTSPFTECMVLCIDAIGEWETLTVWHVKDHKFKKLWNWKYPKSLGLMYSALTQYSGWKPNEEEYIMMGAAARQTYPYELAYNRIFELWNNGSPWHKGLLKLKEWTKKPEIHPEDVPTAAQAVYEDIFRDILKRISNHKLNKAGNIVFVGGCALNVSANRFLSDNFSRVHIPSNPGDSGSAVGCILARARHHINPTPYLGYDIQGPYPIKEIINELQIKRVVGVANGRCEFGPRALGNRTLFGDPRDQNIKQKINETKGREQFRPFAPMILPEDVPKYFNGGFLSPYMSCALEATEEFKQKYPGVVHIDGTSRLQVVDSEPHISLLKIWKDITKCPVLLNTSLNVKGQPIVNTRKDAEDFTKRTGVVVYS
jgi:carbamoyltransferase